MTKWPDFGSRVARRWNWDIAKIVRYRSKFDARLRQVKTNVPLDGRDWYAYDTLSNLTWMERLLTGERRKLIALTGGDPVLDIGSGDGDLAFFLESFGIEVHAIDHPATNYNQMQGIYRLKDRLKSALQIHVQDLDRQFSLPQRYGLTLLLGILYHLRNPFHVLDTISLSSRYCLLSTRIAAFTPAHDVRLKELPVAYLLGDGELNHDHTNFWIFSEAGLRRLFDRTGWRVLDFLTTGVAESDPVHGANDERAFCLLESARFAPELPDPRLGTGWYALEHGARWTAQRFSFSIPSALHGTAELALRFLLPDILTSLRPEVWLHASINGAPLPEQRYQASGEHLYREKFRVPAGASEINIEFALSEAVHAPPDERQLGVLVPFDRWFPLAVMRR